MSTPIVNLRERKNPSGEKVYQIDWTVNGKRKRKTVGTNKKKAQEIQAQIQARLINEEFALPADRPEISLSELIKEYLNHKKNAVKVTSLQRYQNHLDRFNEFMQDFFPNVVGNIQGIKPQYISECLNYLLKPDDPKKYQPLSVASLNRMRQTLSGMFNYAMRFDYLEKNPVHLTEKLAKSKSTQKAEFFTHQELEQIYDKLDSHYEPIIRFLVHTGLRKMELSYLIWDNVNLDPESPSITITSTEEFSTKTNNTRTIPLNKTAYDIIAQQKKMHSDAKYVFLNPAGKRLRKNDVYRALHNALEKTNLTGNVHKLRHTFASHLVMNGASLYDVKELLGHKSIETTQIYAHLADNHLTRVVKLLE